MADPFANVEADSTFAVTEAKREAVPALVSLWGQSDGGKTYSAFRLARGLAGPKGKIVCIDTENKRAKFYAGLFGGWSHVDLQPPYTPQRYTQAMNAALKAGADVVIIDSMSHVWAGEGGVLDQAENGRTASGKLLQGLAKWKTPKMAYMKMVNTLLRSPVHVIFCLRSKELNVQVGEGPSAQIVNKGRVPICGKDFIYDMTVAIQMEGGTHKPLFPVKIPDEIATAIRPGELITEKAGEFIAEWLAGGLPVDHEIEALRSSARGVAMEGTVAFRDWWQSLNKTQKKSCQPIIPELHDLANQADAEMAKRTADTIEGQNSGDPLDDPFTGQAA